MDRDPEEVVKLSMNDSLDILDSTEKVTNEMLVKFLKVYHRNVIYQFLFRESFQFTFITNLSNFRQHY